MLGGLLLTVWTRHRADEGSRDDVEGVFIKPLVATALIAAYGWRNSYTIIGAVVLVTLFSVARIQRRDPQGMGLLPDNGGAEPCGSKNGSTEQGVALRAAAMTRQFWTMCMAIN